MKTGTKIIIICTAIIISFGIAILINYLTFSDVETEIDIYSKDIYERISNELDNKKYIEQMVEITDQEFLEYYDIDMNSIENYTIYTPVIKIKSDEIAIIKLKDEKYIDDIKSKIENRVLDTKNHFSEFVEEEYLKAKDATIFSKGRYVFMIISEYSEEIENIINEIFED